MKKLLLILFTMVVFSYCVSTVDYESVGQGLYVYIDFESDSYTNNLTGGATFAEKGDIENISSISANLSVHSTYAGKFDGTNDGTTSVNMDWNDTVTINFWVNFSTSATKRMATLGKDNSGENVINIDKTNADEIYLIKYESNNNRCNFTTTGGALTNSSWHMVTVLSGPQISIYVDGQQYGNCTDSTAGDDWDYLNSLGVGTFRSGGFSPQYPGDMDDLAIWNRVLTQAELDYLVAGGCVYTFCVDSVIPTIDKATWNVTVAAPDNQTLWRTDQNSTVYVNDSTPSVSFTASETANCSIGKVDQNFSAMVAGDSNRKCSTTDVTDHTCTLPSSDELGYGNDFIYVSCIDASSNEGTISTSGQLNITRTSVSSQYDLTMSVISGGTKVNDTYYQVVQGNQITFQVNGTCLGQGIANCSEDVYLDPIKK